MNCPTGRWRCIFICEGWPSLHTVARDLKLSVRTVQRGIADLKQAGYLGTEQRYRQSGAKGSLLFTMRK
mgnify:CR=1 FL=1